MSHLPVAHRGLAPGLASDTEAHSPSAVSPAAMTELESFSIGLDLEDDQGPLVAIGEYFRTVGCLLSDQMELLGTSCRSRELLPQA